MLNVENPFLPIGTVLKEYIFKSFLYTMFIKINLTCEFVTKYLEHLFEYTVKTQIAHVRSSSLDISVEGNV